MITLPLSLLVGLLLGIVLSRFAPDSSAKSTLRLVDRLRSSLVPLLSLTLCLWLPSSLLVYQEAPDWSLMYLVSPDRATPTLLAGLFTLLTLSVPLGLMGALICEDVLSARLSERWQKRLGDDAPKQIGRLVCGLLGLLCALGLAAVTMLGVDRLAWVGSFADFHDGRWLLAALGTGTPRLFGVLVITNLMVLIGVLFAARAIAGHTPRASQSAIEPASASLP